MNLQADTDMLEYFCSENEKDGPHLIGKFSDYPTVELSPEVLARFAGTYEVHPAGSPGVVRKVSVAVSGKGLTFDYRVFKWTLIPRGQTTFTETNGVPVRFQLDGQGRMTFTVTPFDLDPIVGVRVE